MSKLQTNEIKGKIDKIIEKLKEKLSGNIREAINPDRARKENEELKIVRNIFEGIRTEGVEEFVKCARVIRNHEQKVKLIFHFIERMDIYLLRNTLIKDLKCKYFSNPDILYKWTRLLKTPVGSKKLKNFKHTNVNDIEREIINFLVNMCIALDIKGRRQAYAKFEPQFDMIEPKGVPMTNQMLENNLLISDENSIIIRLVSQLKFKAFKYGSSTLMQTIEKYKAYAFSLFFIFISYIFWDILDFDFSNIGQTIPWILTLLSLYLIFKKFLDFLIYFIPRFLKGKKEENILSLLHAHNQAIEDKIAKCEKYIKDIIEKEEEDNTGKLKDAMSKLYNGSIGVVKQHKLSRMSISQFVLEKSKILRDQKFRHQPIYIYYILFALLITSLGILGLIGYLNDAIWDMCFAIMIFVAACHFTLFGKIIYRIYIYII